ncbi:hypothetical protein C8R46DRAFT_1073131 [Mycena filopes]|nr:hypothetical protein C8R46DRAFT_1073131 [Mycena filopes]
MSSPTYVYKLVPSSSPVPDPLPEVLPLSDLDAASGFIHLSTATQLPGTLKYFFADDDKVVVLRIPYAQHQDRIKWEDPKAEVCGERGADGFFPHLYNGRLGQAEVESVAVWHRTSGSWDEALNKASGWLVY